MDLQKYRTQLLQNMKTKLSDWLIIGENQPVPNLEVYRFLHSIKGTSGTIQLDHLMSLTQELLDSMDKEDEKKTWETNELKNFLLPLIHFTYEYENFHEEAIPENTLRNSAAPLIEVIDDDPAMVMMLKETLEENGYMVMAYTNPEQAVKQYFEMRPDCLILDVKLPSKSGFEILNEIQEHRERYFVPTIMISVHDTKQVRIDAYENGADNFVKKPIDLEEFLAIVKRQLAKKKMFDESIRVDELTKVYNRKFLAENLPLFFQDYHRTKEPFSICILDVDHFKEINDTFGHLAGDKVLVTLGKYVKEAIRSLDQVYRFGGEEFVIVFPKTTNLEAKKRLEEILRGFSQIAFTHEDKEFAVTFSAGIFTVTDERITVEEALRAADNSLYSAKSNGRARIETAVKETITATDYVNVSIVDDNFIIRTLLVNALESLANEGLHLHVKAFEDGPSFLHSRHAAEDASHLLILDGVMPKMDGIDVLQQVKQQDISKNYKVLMLSGRSNKEDVERALVLGADDYVVKPFNISELKTRIERILNSMV